MRIKNKITLLFTLLTGTIILVLCTFIYFFAQRTTHENFFHRLEVRSELVAHSKISTNSGRSEIYFEFKNKYLKDLPGETHRRISFINEKELTDYARISKLPLDFFNEAILRGQSRYLSTDTAYVGTYLNVDGARMFLLSTAIDEAGYEELNSLRKSILVSFCVALVVVFSLGRFFASLVFRPIKDIIKRVKIIKASNLHLRLELGKGKDELYDLSVTFNNMLNRLETVFELQNNFVSNASHELKTPLTVISGEAELGIRSHQDPVAVKASLEKIISESERLEHLMNSLLSLAQTGFDGKKMLMEKVRIDELILSVKLAANRIFPNNKIEIDYDRLPEDEEKLAFMGNPVMVKAALLNVFINACKYSGQQKVRTIIHTDDRSIVVTVIDTGIGIPKEDMPKIFVPFFRASNTNSFMGYGVGLPLSLNIVKMHGGKIEAESEVGKGTTVRIFLPFIQ